MRCAIEDALSRHQEKLAKQEASLELFMDSIDDVFIDTIIQQEYENSVSDHNDRMYQKWKETL